MATTALSHPAPGAAPALTSRRQVVDRAGRSATREHSHSLFCRCLRRGALPGLLELVGGSAAELIERGHRPVARALELRPFHEALGGPGHFLKALLAGAGAEHIASGTTDDHTERTSPPPSAGTARQPPATPPDGPLRRLDAAPRSPASPHGAGGRQESRADEQPRRDRSQHCRPSGTPGHGLPGGLCATAPPAPASGRSRDRRKPADRRGTRDHPAGFPAPARSA
jgi:hypothetical protein